MEKDYKKKGKDMSGSKNPMFGKKQSQETKDKIRLKAVGRITSEETKKKLSDKGKGRIFSKEHKDNLSKSLKGKQNFLGQKHTEEWKTNSSKRQLGGKHPHKGYVMSDKQKEQISKSREGSTPWNKGKTNVYSEETKKKISNSLRGKMAGDKCPLWKGGVTPLVGFLRGCFEYRQWRSDVFTRDKFTCQECGDYKGGNLNAHHVKYFSHILEEYKIKTKEESLNCEELWNINNGITLCDICHINKHKK